MGRVKDRVGEVRWNESFTGPVKNFYQIATEEYSTVSEENRGTDLTEFLGGVKDKLLDAWNENVVANLQRES